MSWRASTGDDTDDLLRPVKQWQARQECKDLSRVTIRGLLTRCSEGWWNRGTPPYGYDLGYFAGDGRFLMTVRYQADCSKRVLDEEGNVVREVPRGDSLTFSNSDRCRLVPSAPERVEVLRNIFNWYVHDGLRFKGVADRLNRDNVPSRRNGNWSSRHHAKWAMTTIRDMLLNPAYTGDAVWNRLTSAKFHRVSQGRAVPRSGLPGGAPEHNRPADWLVVKDAHPPLIPRAIFEQAQAKRAARRNGLNCQTYRNGHGATSSYLLSGLIRCRHFGHHWHGYTTRKGRKRNDGSQVKTHYYACNGYIAKGTSCCGRAVIPQEFIEGWVLEQSGGIVHEYLDDGGQKKLRRMIEQELVGTGCDGSEQAALEQRKADIEATIDNLLDNITPTNRDFVDRRIEKLRGEMAELERQEAVLGQQQDREHQAALLADHALALARSFDRLLEVGTIEEKRTLIRAFLRGIDYDPTSQAGKAHFLLVPNAGHDDVGAGPSPGGLRKDPAQQMSSGSIGSGDTRYHEKRRAASDGTSSVIMVAGACFVAVCTAAARRLSRLPRNGRHQHDLRNKRIK